MYYDYKTVDEAGSIYTDEPKQKQLDAYKFLERHILNEPQWLRNQAYMNRLLPDAQGALCRVGERVLANMLSVRVLNRLTTTYPVEEYLPALLQNLFAEAKSGTKPSVYRSEMQRVAVQSLIVYFQQQKRGKAYPEVLAQLRLLQRQCNATDSQPHFAALADLINRALAIK